MRQHIRSLFRRTVALSLVAAATMLSLASQPSAWAFPTVLGTAFTYQGLLKSGGSPINGTVDIKVRLFDAAAAGVQIGSEIDLPGVTAVDGQVSVNLDFGALAFNGEARWLEIDIRSPAGSGSYSTLSPRQAVLAAPYAVFASNIAPTATPFQFNAANAVFTGGKVGIGTTNPSARLEISSTTPYDQMLVLRAPTGVVTRYIDTDGGMGWDMSMGNDWTISRSGIDYPFSIRGDTGNVGIGTTTPSQKLDVNGNVNVSGSITGSGAGLTNLPWGSLTGVPAGFADGMDDTGGGGPWVTSGSNVYYNGGNVGIGTSSPVTKLDIRGPGATITVGNTSNNEGTIYFGHPNHGIGRNYQGVQNCLGIWTTSGKIKLSADGSNAHALCIEPGGNIGIGTDSPSQRLDVNGDAIVNVLTIRGGADLVEGFDSSHDHALEPGTVVVIDPDNAGSLMQSTETYDIKVAGVVSGANGVEPGIHLGQESVMDGDTKVAMTGRVYVKCSTENGAIRPGTLLTTASLAGHAMAATDAARSNGAVIGKAMSSLDEGAGLVLVLVNLQ